MPFGSRDKFKILKNANILYSRRIYAEFNTEIKRFKLRKRLTEILKDPHIYLRQYVAENIYNTFIVIKNLKLSNTMLEVHNRYLYPGVEVFFLFLIQICWFHFCVFGFEVFMKVTGPASN